MKEVPTHYSLLKEDDKHFHLHDSRDNTSFKIAKKDVHPATQMKILKVKKYDEGGDVEGEEEEIPQGEAVQSMRQGQEEAGLTPAPVQAQAQPMAASGPPGAGADSSMLDQFNRNSKAEQGALYAQGKARSDQGQTNAQTFQDSNDAIKNVIYNSQQKLWNMDVDNENLTQAVANAKIDPDRYVHNLSTGKKIMNAISMVLGGVGAGLTHGRNMAVDAFNKHIDDDIAAQKADLGKKQSLLSMNMQRYRDMNMATQATMVQMNSLVQGQLAQSAAKFGSQADLQGVNATIAQLKNKQMMDAMGLKQMVMQNDMRQHLMQGDVAGQNPMDYVKWVVPPAQQEKVANELGVAQATTQNEGKIMALFQQAAKDTRPMTGLSAKASANSLLPGYEPDSIKGLKMAFDPIIRDNDGRYNVEEAKDVQQNFPQAWDSDATVQNKMEHLQDFMNHKKQAPLAKTNGIDINRFNSTKGMGSVGSPVERITKDGKRALFDPSTKRFLGYKPGG